MKFKLDENIGARGVAVLKGYGHDVSTVAEQGLSGATDTSLFDVCKAEGRAVVSLDLDFAMPSRFPPKDSSGIVVLRLPTPQNPEHLYSAIRTLAAYVEREPLEGRLLVIEPGRVREYGGPQSD